MEIYLRGRGDYDVSVLGESEHQSFLEKACGGRRKYSAKHRSQATLKFEGEIVAVVLGDRAIGVLPEKDAAALRQYLGLAGYLDAEPKWCEAMIVGGWNQGEKWGAFGVKVDLPGEVVEGPPCWPDGSSKIPRV